MRRYGLLLACWLLPALALHAADEAADVFRPGENLVAEGIPAVPASLVERARAYTEYRTADLLDWHPTKREMLIGTRFADSVQVHHVASPLGDRRQLTFFPDRVLGASYQPKKAEYFLLSKDRGGNEFYQFYRQDLATGAGALVTDGASRNTGAVWSNGGDRVAYGSTRRNKSDVDFYLANPTDPTSTKLLAENSGGGWAVVDWSPDDKQLLASETLSINEGYVWLIDAADGHKTLVTPKGSAEKIAYEPVAFAKDGKGIYVRTDRESEFVRLAYIDLASKQHAYLTADIPWDIETAKLSRDGKRIAFVSNQNGISHLHVLDTATKKITSFPPALAKMDLRASERSTRRASGDVHLLLPSGVIAGLEWHENGRDLGFVLTSARSPADVYSIDVEDNKLERWTASETGGLEAKNFVEPKRLSWKSFDDREISGFLYQPPARFKGKRPVIINIHGGPEGQSRPIFLGRNNFFLDELGIAIIFPNIRGSSGYGKSFLQLDNGFLREDSYKDIGALLDWIKSRDDLDADRVMVTGGSYGGHMTLAVATRYNDRIRCSLDVVGISNLVTFLERTESYRRDLRRVEYGDERDPKMRAFLECIAPLNHAGDIKKPLFVVQGKNDPRVPLSESEQMITTVRKGNTPVWYLMAQDEGHGFAKKKNADFQFYATIAFLQKFLLSEGAP
jgi:protease II